MTGGAGADTFVFRSIRYIHGSSSPILIDVNGNFQSRQCADRTLHAPCMFEYVYLARPDSLMDGMSVYETRVKMGEFLADKIRHTLPHLKIEEHF